MRNGDRRVVIENVIFHFNIHIPYWYFLRRPNVNAGPNYRQIKNFYGEVFIGRLLTPLLQN